MTRKKLPRTPYLNPQFSAAVKEFGIALLKTQSIHHKGNRGSARENTLSRFFVEQLPNRYGVTEGEVIDLEGRTSPQLDLMFYDASVDFPFKSEGASILPAEALLASIEVKTTINAGEIAKSVTAAQKLRSLRPFGRPLADNNIQNIAGDEKRARYFHCLFAYQSDLTSNNWLIKEADRFSNACSGEYIFDLVYVLDRGLIHVDHRIGRLEDDEGGAITNFYFSVLNFIEREGGRRGRTPLERYTQPAANAWLKI